MNKKSRRGTALHLPNRYWSEIGLGSGFEEWGGTPPPGIARDELQRKNQRHFMNWALLSASQLIIS